MMFYRIGRGKSTHAHAQWYNSVSVGNSLAAVAMPVYGRAPIHSQVYNGTTVSLALYKTFWVWVTHLLLLLLVLYMEAHTYMQYYYIGSQLGFWLCNITQFWVWVVHGNSLSTPPWAFGVPVGKVGRHQVMLFMSACATAWPPAPWVSAPSSCCSLGSSSFFAQQSPPSLAFWRIWEVWYYNSTTVYTIYRQLHGKCM